MTFQNLRFKVVLVEEFGSTAEGPGVLPGIPEMLFAPHIGHFTQAGTVRVSEAGTTSETEAGRSIYTTTCSGSKAPTS